MAKAAAMAVTVSRFLAAQTPDRRSGERTPGGIVRPLSFPPIHSFERFLR